ncbi:DNA recombination protein RecT [Enterococcus florum]|uniref:DNA recombination protein RecT n=1 Tax=Enterococcus florum TaxID=2480627 RepID=A0A4P5PG55_9ENTE|nr:RecT family recombinase [Enterococcus florum]GCF92473.1 DNA recombination protein RecT [Enterococcus florum]
MSNELSITQKDITDQVNSRIKGLENEGLQLPVNYNAANALKSAWFAIQKVQDKNKRPALEVVTKDSVANSLLDMVVQGLSPAKTQLYFVVYGKELQMQRSYFGTQAVLKRLSNVRDIWAEVIHDEDEFEIGSKKGRMLVTKFHPKFENQDKPIVGAYAVVEKDDGELIYTVMTKKEIDQAWSKRKNSGAVQKEFPQEMAKRTVINRAAKSFINTSDDSDLLTDSINRTTAEEYDSERKDVTPQPEKTKALEEKVFKQDEPRPVEEIVEEAEQESLDLAYEDPNKMNFEREEVPQNVEDGDYPF